MDEQGYPTGVWVPLTEIELDDVLDTAIERHVTVTEMCRTAVLEDLVR